MSSGVSDQMKVPGITAKNVEERSIPWSQQVDEAAYDLPSPTTDDNAVANQGSMKFQYPPFNIKENQNFSWNNYKSRKSNNFDGNKKHGKPSFYNNTRRDDFQPNANNLRKSISDKLSNKPEEGYNAGKLDNRPSSSTISEEKKTNVAPSVVAPKKTTWASIASQPAKLTSRTTLTASSHKKKGPGMPPPPMVPGRHNLDVNTWDLPNNNPPPVPSPPPPINFSYAEISSEISTGNVPECDLGATHLDKGQKGFDISKEENKLGFNNSNFSRVRNSPNGHSRKSWFTQNSMNQNRQANNTNTNQIRRNDPSTGAPPNRFNDRRAQHANTRSEHDIIHDLRDENSPRNTKHAPCVDEIISESPQAVLDELRDKNNYNPAEIDMEKASSARFFVIKSYSEDDIHRSIKYEIWCSTDHGNKRLDDAFKERHKEGGDILLFFSVNGSGHFCGMAQMMTAVDYNSTSSVWSQDKWKGKFKVKWIYVKDVPNNKLRHIRLENNDNKSVTNSRDTQEVPNARGIEVLQILHSYQHSTSIFDDFYHYEKKQEEEVSSKRPIVHDNICSSQTLSPFSRQNNRQNDDRDRDRERERDSRSSGAPKYFGVSTSFRDRNNAHRGFHNSYNDRRFESHRTPNNADHQQKDRDIDTDRENCEYGNRNIQKNDYNRRDERTQSKHNIRERDFNDDHNKYESRFRAGSKEM